MTGSKKTKKTESDLSKLRNMEEGQERTFPISKLSNIRTMCSSYGLQWGMKFTTKTDRKKGTVTVSRIS